MENHGLKGIYSKDNEYTPIIKENRNTINITNHILTFKYSTTIIIIKIIKINKAIKGCKTAFQSKISIFLSYTTLFSFFINNIENNNIKIIIENTPIKLKIIIKSILKGSIKGSITVILYIPVQLILLNSSISQIL